MKVRAQRSYSTITKVVCHKINSSISIARRNNGMYEAIDNDGNLLFLIEKASWKDHAYRWHDNTGHSEWYDRIHSCVRDGIMHRGVTPSLSKEDVIDLIRKNVVYSARYKNSVSIKGTAVRANLSPYIVVKFIDEALDKVSA